jgi:hypothetical protein
MSMKLCSTRPATLSQPATVPRVSKSRDYMSASHTTSLSPVDKTDCPNRPNTMLDKADNIAQCLVLDSVANKDGHRYLMLVSYVYSDSRSSKHTATLGRKQRSIVERSYTRSVQCRVDKHGSDMFLAQRPHVK